MKKTEYDIEVVFYTSVYIPVKAFGPDEAMDKAEDLAYAEFDKMLKSGKLNPGDFCYEAQTP